MSQGKHIKMAAIQLCAELADVEKNLVKAEHLIRKAAKQKAEWVILPEFFTSACAFHPAMHKAILPRYGKAAELLKNLSRELNIVIGGSYLAKHENDVFNSFMLVFPDGVSHIHNKDIPTMWESCYYIGGNDDGVFKTKSYDVGVALCWEMLRTKTARRLAGKVDFVVSGSCWWNLPETAPKKFDSLRQTSLELLQSTPTTFAKLLGVPVIHAGHAGDFEGFAPPGEEKKYSSHYLGQTMIVDSKGEIIKKLSREEGEAVIVAEITVDQTVESSMEIQEEYWIPKMPKAFLAEWEKLNTFGKKYYQGNNDK